MHKTNLTSGVCINEMKVRLRQETKSILIYVESVGLMDSIFYCRDICSSMFVSALLIQARKWNSTRYLTTDESNKKNVVHAHSEIIFSCKIK